MKNYSEKEIIKGCKKNSRKFQEILYLNYFDKMYGMCIRHTSDANIAMSVLNDGFIKVYKNIGKYRFEGSFEGWIRKIVYNSICDYYRKSSNNQKFIEIEDRTLTSDILNILEYEEIIELVNTLSESSRRVFIMHAVEGYTHREIAEKENISISTSKWNLAKAKRKLKQLITENQALFLEKESFYTTWKKKFIVRNLKRKVGKR